MIIDKENYFTLNGITLFPAIQGNRHGYVQQGREWDLFEWQDLEAVTRFSMEAQRGIIQPLDFEDNGLCRQALQLWLQFSRSR